ncbi:hypothetical protein ATO13_09641 [Stappia sp. 22II-S9-Z10]|nr:hypothetical protein ATO13_09641 [Stappia sp. 22II-S9-Z10]
MFELHDHSWELIGLYSDAKAGHPPPDADVAEDLASLLSFRAVEASRYDADQALFHAPDYPGYVSRSLDGLQIYVPFPLARAFPGAQSLRDIVAFAVDIGIGTGAICISGSGAMSGTLHHLGDLDFCEYVFEAGELMGIAALCDSASPSSRTALAAINCKGTVFIAPWDGIRDALEQLTRTGPPATPATHFLKLDYCAWCTTFGPIPATNRVLWLSRDDPEQGDALNSFAHQEAVIARGGSPVRTLISAERIGAYLVFLEREITAYKDKNPVKALKRALSFSAVVGIEPWYKDAVRLLNHEAVGRTVRQRRFREFAELASSVAPHARSGPEAALQHAANLTHYTWDTIEIVPDTVLNEITSLLNHISLTIESWGDYNESSS